MWMPLEDVKPGALIEYRVGHGPYLVLDQRAGVTTLFTPEETIETTTETSYVFNYGYRRSAAITLASPTGVQHLFSPYTLKSNCGLSVSIMTSGQGKRCKRCYG